MPLTVITITNAPNSLRGDLAKWMQEVGTGVYVGNFNSRIREQLWKRVTESIGNGQATMTFAARNEIGYDFVMHKAHRQSINYDGIPLVFIPKEEVTEHSSTKRGFSDAAKFRKVNQIEKAKVRASKVTKNYVVLDIETDGLNNKTNEILEIGAIKIVNGKTSQFDKMIEYSKKLPEEIIKLTGITQVELNQKGLPLKEVLADFKEFIEDFPLVGYSINFDLGFLNYSLKQLEQPLIKNRNYDLLKYIKNDRMFLQSYSLDEVLLEYEIDQVVEHRGLKDAELIYDLSMKVNGFLDLLPRD